MTQQLVEYTLKMQHRLSSGVFEHVRYIATGKCFRGNATTMTINGTYNAMQSYRNLNALADFCSPEDMQYLRRFKYISSAEDLQRVRDFCSNHAAAKVRGK